MFKLKNLCIAACLLGLTIYTAPALASICFAPSGGCVDALGSDVGDDRDSQGALNECIGFTLYAPEEGEGWSCSSCTQTTGTTLYKCRRNECGSEYNIKKDSDEPPHPLPGWECEYCMRGYEKFWTCPKHYCAPKYGEKKHSASAAKFTCEGSNPDTCPHGDDILYNCECDADHVEREIDGVASCVRLCTEEHREYNPQTDKCECEQYYKELNGKCVHEEYSADCQAILNNFYAVNYSPLSNSECDSLKIRLGIKKCLGGSDYWAGAVKKCGGVDYMPTSDQLTKLAQCMYNSSSLATSIYGKRNDSYLEELRLSTDDHVFVWQDYQNKNNTKSMVRMFAKNGSIPYWAERDGSKYYTGNGANPTNWENNSILSQTLCIKNDEPAVSCEGCDYCIASTCKDSGEKRIISDSSTYEKCADSCGGKYRCKTGYTAKYADSNQYKCVRTSGCYYDTVAQCKTAGYTYTAEERWWMQDENMTHECEPCDCGGTEMNKCVPVGGGDYATLKIKRSNYGNWPYAGGADIALEPSINVCGHELTLNMSNGDSYDLSTGKTVELQVPAGKCDMTFSGLWYQDHDCYIQGWITVDDKTLSFTGPDNLDMSQPQTIYNPTSTCGCATRGGKNSYTFEKGKTYNITVFASSLGCNWN